VYLILEVRPSKLLVTDKVVSMNDGVALFECKRPELLQSRKVNPRVPEDDTAEFVESATVLRPLSDMGKRTSSML
jgi:hypothetical protein